jgi:hypothetical protein
VATSRVPDVIGWLVDTCAAAATLGAATPPVQIRCGAEVTSGFTPLALWVGLDNPTPLDTVTLGAESTQTRAGYGTNRDEALIVYCCAEAWSGDTDSRGALTAAYGITSAVETIVRANPTLGGFAMLADPGPTGYRLLWHQGEGGAAARVQFQIAANAAVDA